MVAYTGRPTPYHYRSKKKIDPKVKEIAQPPSVTSPGSIPHPSPVPNRRVTSMFVATVMATFFVAPLRFFAKTFKKLLLEIVLPMFAVRRPLKFARGMAVFVFVKLTKGRQSFKVFKRMFT